MGNFIPAGVYMVQAIDSSVVEINEGNFQLKLTFEILDGPYATRKLWQSIGKRALSDLFLATGSPPSNHSDALHFKPFMATVTANGIIKAYKPIDYLYSVLKRAA
jgi:hypothetical protein